MPDITFPKTFTTGDLLESVKIQSNIYRPESTPQTLEVINGRLDQDNLAAATDVGPEVVRRGTNATAITRGHTANIDFYDDMFQGDYVADTYSEAIPKGQVVVGTTFYVPYRCQAIYLSWHVSLIIDAGLVYSLTAGPAASEGNSVPYEDVDATGLAQLSVEPGNTLLVLHIDGHPIKPMSRRIKHGHTTMLGTTYYDTTVPAEIKSMPTGAVAKDQFNDPLQPDHRWWSGHCVIDRENDTVFLPSGAPHYYSKGWHTLDIRVTLGNWVFPVTLDQKTAKQVKFKTCRATAIPIR
jgi:hypothetical protein